jgi:SHAQKYF class myb-like DNA-binding protein
MMICESLPSSILLAADSEKTGRWTDEEHAVFLQGLETHGKQWKVIAAMIGTRNVVQVRTHAQKYFQKLKRKQQNNSSVLSLQEESAEGAADATDIKNKKFKSSNGKPRIVIPASKQQCASQPPTPTAVTDLLDIWYVVLRV